MTSIILVGFANVCVSRVENIIWRLSSRRCFCCCCWCFCSWRKWRWQVWSIAKRRRVARLRALIKRIVQRTLVQVTRRQTRVVIAAPARVRSLRHDLSIRLTLARVILSHKKWKINDNNNKTNRIRKMRRYSYYHTWARPFRKTSRLLGTSNSCWCIGRAPRTRDSPCTENPPAILTAQVKREHNLRKIFTHTNSTTYYTGRRPRRWPRIGCVFEWCTSKASSSNLVRRRQPTTTTTTFRLQKQER